MWFLNCMHTEMLDNQLDLFRKPDGHPSWYISIAFLVMARYIAALQFRTLFLQILCRDLLFLCSQEEGRMTRSCSRLVSGNIVPRDRQGMK